MTLFYRWEREKEKRETERKKSTRANINCEENCKKKWWQFFYIYIQCNGVTSIERNLGRRQRCSFLFFLVSVVGAVMYLTHEREYLCSSLFFSSSCADEMKKKRRKKENRKKQMSPCYVERFARQWSLIDVSRFSYFVSLNLCIIIIIIISIYLLKFPLLFLLFFVRMTSRSHWSSTPIAIGSDYCLYTSSNTNSSYFCCCQYNGKRKTLSTFLSIFLIVWL